MQKDAERDQKEMKMAERKRPAIYITADEDVGVARRKGQGRRSGQRFVLWSRVRGHANPKLHFREARLCPFAAAKGLEQCAAVTSLKDTKYDFRIIKISIKCQLNVN